MSTDQPVDPETIEKTKHQIRGLVSEIAQLSKEDLAPEQFYGEFLQRVVTALAAVGGAVWTLGEGGRLDLAFQINLRTTELGQDSKDQVRHARLLHQSLQQSEGILVPPYSGAAEEDDPGNPTRFLLVLAPLQGEEGPVGIVEVFQRPDSGPATQRGYLRFLRQMCELATGWIKNRTLRQFSDRQSLWAQAEHFSRIVHDSLDRRETAYSIANEGRRLIGCDRVSVAVRKGRRCTIEAVSGQDTFDTRSNAVVLLGRLATKVVATGETLWYTGSTEDLAPQVEEALEEYVDESHSKMIVVIPLTKKTGDSEDDATGEDEHEEEIGEIYGAIIIEQIEESTPQSILGPKLKLVGEHSSRAMANVYKHNEVFLMPLWQTIGRSSWIIKARTLPKTIAILSVIVAFLLAVLVIPIDFDLEGRGELLPVQRRDVFADIQGVVTKVHAGHGDTVQKGQVLLELRNIDQELQYQEALGNEAKIQSQLLAVRSRASGRRLTDAEKKSLASQQLGYAKELKNLAKQIALLDEKNKLLQVISPISGQVITWDTSRLLLHRYVMPGQIMMTIADPLGDWELAIYMPEDRMGYVTQAKHTQQKDDLDVTYIVASNPSEKLFGKIKKTHLAADLHDEHGHSVQVLVEIKKEDLKDPKPNATVTAKIRCGRASIAYVWLRDVIEFIQTRVLF